MLVAGVIISIPVIFILWVVFTPVYLRINTETSLYEIVQPGIVRVSGQMTPPYASVRVLGIKIPFRLRPQAKPAQLPKVAKRSSKRLTLESFQLGSRILRSVKLTRVYVNVDFDDVAWNAKLVPVCMALSRQGMVIQTNFIGRYIVDIEAVVRLNKIMWALLVFHTKRSTIWK